MKISTRLIFLLAFLLAGLVVIGALGLYAADRANSALESTYNTKLIPIAQMDAIARANLGNRLAIANAIMRPENMAEHIREIGENKSVIDKQWEAFMASLTDDEDKILAAKFADARGRFVEEGIKPAVAAMRANNAAEIRRIQAEHITPLNVPLNETMGALIEMEKRDAEKLHLESVAAFKTMREFSIALILLGAALGCALGFSIIRSINRSVGELCGVMVKMSADGDLSARAKVYGQDEIGQAATAFNGLID
ncbi:MAG: MCP four helix bundle domain-containing protein, partial [Gallionella sp.]|nr:MCP four helix bundle domain-containing protein [Gallionella sp.]